MEEDAIGEGSADVAVLGKVLDEVIVGNFAGLFESIPCMFDFSIDRIVMDKTR